MVPKSQSLLNALYTHKPDDLPEKKLQLVTITTHPNTSAFITERWLTSKNAIILLMRQVLRKLFKLCERDKRLAFLTQSLLSPHSLKTTCVRKYFSLIFFFFFIKSLLIFFYRKTKRYSSECVVKEAHFCIPIRGLKLRGFLQCLSWKSLSVMQRTKRNKISQNYLLWNTSPFCFCCHISAIVPSV